ncbi:GntR family transcriptional regulator [Actinomadura syzygii]|uniref:GntR family transcriptional regulator n=1 Tax=Actinomadura syzygii TaxID=1427538 RepID=A0A5D0UE56_9ACTN|nr:GntR family transcriptional regulator [Actinomadura syzygii]TYC15942.1 GntR family transcriptional regulator [Actinomadura syzygii]
MTINELAAGSGPREEPNLREQAYERMREQIFTRELEPGMLLSEVRLAKAYGISRTPVREAIKQLAQAGLVRLVPGRGAFVTELAPHDVVEIYELREQLECYAIRIGARRLTDEQIAELEVQADEADRLREAGDLKGAFELAVATHRRFTRAARNARLARILEQLEDESRRVSHLTFTHPGRLSAALAEHRDILTALRARDGDAAEAALRAHLRADRDAAVDQFAPDTY